MKTKLSLISVFIFSAIVSVAQKNKEIKEVLKTVPTEMPKDNQQEEIYTVVEEMPMFPGGKSEMEKFIQTNLVFPKSAVGKNINGRCYINIIIESDGTVSSPKVLKGIANCSECDTEAVRVITMMPKWLPGKQNGREVSVYYNLPINFKR